jgi:flagellar hook-basal body complex protein FliE
MKIDTSQLLAQMRLAAAQAGRVEAQPARVERPVENPAVANFSSLLTQSINSVHELQQTSRTMEKDFQLGKAGVNLAEVMVAKAKSSVAFDGMVQVRNKMVEAYQEVMRMQV